MRDYLENIRYREWPEIGLGIDLEPHEFDELLSEATRVHRRAKIAINKEKKLNASAP